MPGFGKRVALTVSPDAGACQVGQPVTVRVRALARKHCHVERGEAVLQARIETGERQYHLGWPSQRTSAVTRTLTLSRAELPIAGPLSSGATVECQAVLSNPATCPSGRGERVSVEYLAGAELELTGGRTVSAQAQLVPMTSDRALYQGVEGRPRVEAFGACQLELLLPTLHARPGESLAGRLAVRPHHPLLAQRIRVYWHRVEIGYETHEYLVLRHTRGSESQFPSRLLYAALPGSADLARDVALTGPQEFPFSVRVPERVSVYVPNNHEQACPTLLAPCYPVVLRPLEVHWYVRAEVHHRKRPPDLLEREINVHRAR